MKNKDLQQKQREELRQSLREALDSGDNEKALAAFDAYAQGIQNSLLETAAEISATADTTILAKRGIRQLTSVEQSYYEKLRDAMKSDNPRQALNNPELVIPQTVVDTVISDIESNHPLLSAINIQNTFGGVKWIYADDVKQLASWNAITSAITTELEGNIHTLEFSANKLSAFIPVPKDILDLAPAYLDAYVRKILSEALAYGLENGSINGSGKNEPIGLIKDLNGAVTNGVYPDKTKVKLKSLSVKDYCAIVSKLAKKSTGKARSVQSVALIVNPIDYIEKIVPATTVLATDGSYKGNIFPYPTNVYQSECITEGSAVIGIINNYAMCLTSGKDGKIDFSDQYQFLEDNRVYLTKLYGTGRAKDNNDFIYLDISELAPLELSVSLKNSATT